MPAPTRIRICSGACAEAAAISASSTNFEFRLHPMQREVVAGSVNFPIARARDVLSMYAQYAATAPDELYLDPVLVLPARGAPGVVSLEVCYSGPQEKAEAALAPIRKLGTAGQGHAQGEGLCRRTARQRYRRFARHRLVPQGRLHLEDAGPTRFVDRRRHSGRPEPDDGAVLPALRRRGFAPGREAPPRSRSATPSPT